MFYLVYDTNGVFELPKGLLIGTLAFSLALSVAFYLLRSIGVYKLAKGSGVKNAGLAFVPFFWVYTACKAIGESSGFFGKTFKSVALLLGIIFTAFSVLSLFYDVLTYYPLASYIISAGDSARVYYTGGAYEVSSLTAYPFDSNFYLEGFVNAYPAWLITGMRVIRIFTMIGSLVTIVIEVSVYFSLFRKFWPAHYILASLLSIFLSLFPIFVFAIRNNKGMNYADYMREKYERYYAQRRGYNPNGATGTGTADSGAENAEPFDDFKGKEYNDGGEPFEEFSDDKKDK